MSSNSDNNDDSNNNKKRKVDRDDYNEYHPNLIVCTSKALPILFTKLRNKTTNHVDFVKYSKRVMRIVAEEALAEFPTIEVDVETPCGPCKGIQHVGCNNGDNNDDSGNGNEYPSNICAVSIVRSGDALLESVLEVEPGIKVGKILIQRDEEHPEKIPKLFYSKLPPNVSQSCNGGILLCDPMLATGGSAMMAIQVLQEKYQIDTSKIIFANVICAPEGLQAMSQKYPEIKIVTACVDEKLNSDKFIVPGLGDYGDRFFGTTED